MKDSKLPSTALLPSTPLNELFDIASAFAAIWGAAFCAAWVVEFGLRTLTVPTIPTLIASGIVLLGTVLFLFMSIDKGTSFTNALLRWRHVAILLVVFVAGIQWHKYEYSSCDEAQSRKAASTYAQIPPAQK